MSKKTNTHLILAFSLLLLSACSSTAPLYRYDSKNKISSGSFDEETYTTLRKFLGKYSISGLKDTMIIKYDYNNEGCWNSLDQMDDNYIQKVIDGHSQRVKQAMANRPAISVFDFREPGNQVNKLKKLDHTILIDSSLNLLNLVFKDRSRCGNSIIILPDRRYVFLRSDSHSEALDFSQSQIVSYLSKK